MKKFVLLFVPLLAFSATSSLAGGQTGSAAVTLWKAPVDSSASTSLQVFSARQKLDLVNPHLEVYIQGNPGLDRYHLAHTDYSIHSANGQLLMKVRNAIGINDATPAIVSLPPGSYRITALAQDHLPVTIPLEIKRNHATLVYLDRDWRNFPLLNEPADFISIPDGTLVYFNQEPKQLARAK